MSHVAKIDLHIKDLDALGLACERLGTVELVRNVDRYKWYGRHVGDYELPEGFSKSDMGKCTHVIRVKRAGVQTYEIGVCERRDGQPGYVLLWDFFMGGYGLVDAVGQNAEKLKHAYGIEASKRSLVKCGFTKVREQKLANGAVRLRYAKR